jgi:hypothetical protein
VVVLKARIVDPEHQLYNEIFNVSFISVDTAAGIDIQTGEIIAASFDDIEFIYELPYEEEIIKHREILSIKKPREASFAMYSVILNCMEEFIGGDIESIVIVNDVDSKSKKVWVKHINAAVNGIPISIDISGKKYDNVFDIKVSDINKDEFIFSCEREICKVQNGLKLYTKRLNGLMYTIAFFQDL